MTVFYLDTSVAVHALRGTAAAVNWFDGVTADADDMLVSSRILQTELTRVQRRDARPVAERDDILRYMGTVPITESILASAESIAEHVKTLDSIHLASALAVGSGTLVVSHDANVKRVAVALGLSAFDPMEPPSQPATDTGESATSRDEE